MDTDTDVKTKKRHHRVLLAVPMKLVEAADERAKQECRTRSDLFREALRRYLNLTPSPEN